MLSNFTSTLTALSAMITPAVLILATGQLILTTSQRLARSMDRARKLSDSLEDMKAKESLEPVKNGINKEALLFLLLKGTARRSIKLQKAMSVLYIALSLFVCTSVSIGLLEVFGFVQGWIPVTLGLSGVALMFYATILLITETRIALGTVDKEMEYLLMKYKHKI
ncbi:MAG: DUF2721 domain-containing protein [Bacteroidota bacterium]|jgi:hypothetical protein|nr:DUF2721 domain-containing protein [Bacteroidota bacterium]